MTGLPRSVHLTQSTTLAIRISFGGLNVPGLEKNGQPFNHVRRQAVDAGVVLMRLGVCFSLTAPTGRGESGGMRFHVVRFSSCNDVIWLQCQTRLQLWKLIPKPCLQPLPLGLCSNHRSELSDQDTGDNSNVDQDKSRSSYGATVPATSSKTDIH